MEITDIKLESHIVSEGKFTEEQLKEIEQLLETPTEVNLKQIAEVLEKGEHNLIQVHAHSMQISNFDSQTINEENSDYLDRLQEIVNQFNPQQDNKKKV